MVFWTSTAWKLRNWIIELLFLDLYRLHSTGQEIYEKLRLLQPVPKNKDRQYIMKQKLQWDLC